MRALTTQAHTTHTHACAANAELGQMVQMTSIFGLNSNALSSAIPTGECMRAHELHELSATAHHTHTIASAASLRGHQRDAHTHHSDSPSHKPIHMHARPM